MMERDDSRFPAAAGGDMPLDLILDTLRERRRRYVLYLLRRNEVMAVETVADRIAAFESDPADADRDPAYEAVLISLHHKHLPRLNDLGIVEYDRRSGAIRFDSLPEDFEEVLAVTCELDECLPTQ